jgi:hypothetical protein
MPYALVCEPRCALAQRPVHNCDLPRSTPKWLTADPTWQPHPFPLFLFFSTKEAKHTAGHGAAP